MNYKRKEFWIPTVIGLFLILLVSGILIYRNFFRAEEWRIYDQIKSKPRWVEWVYEKLENEEYLRKFLAKIARDLAPEWWACRDQTADLFSSFRSTLPP